MQAMSDLRALAATVVMTGFDGTSLDERTRERFRETGFGGFVLFARNVASIEQVRALTDDLRSVSSPAPLIAVDQEGGRVARLRDGVEALPPMMALGATRDVALACRAGEQLAFDLRRAGFTVDFAPVVDLALHAANTVIGSRAFGESPALVTELACALVAGMNDGGIAATLKHFPGHGDTSVDSHIGLPVIDASAATLRARDLRPYEALLGASSAVMAAHVVARAFDSRVPASLSPALLTGLLRDELGFDGVCFTDCMQMDAIAKGIGTVAGVGAAIAAGADCAIVSQDLDLAAAAVDHLVSEVGAGRIPHARLQEAAARVMRLRASIAQPVALDAPAPHPGVGREIARRAVTLVRGVAHADPTASIIVSFEGTTTEGAQGRLELRSSLRAQAAALEELVAPLEPQAAETSALLEAVERSGRRPILLLRRASSLPSQAQAARRIIERFPDAVIVAAREPYDCALFANARHLLAIYGDSDVSLAGLADVLFGDGEARGVLPVELSRA
ncbi:MAG TPA: beta-N-acetylhexosaminidase [Candidatus Aquilonibacter sp.]|nr:beta-N-acetylhexosaminidase [Candidatus Aquilonibacter sp.]